jgi:hypothetical protein
LLYGMLGLADRAAPAGAWLARGNEASMPFYILHQTVIVLLALWLLPWNTPLAIKYLVLVVVAFGVTTLLTWGVMRVPRVGPLFGLKRRV